MKPNPKLPPGDDRDRRNIRLLARSARGGLIAFDRAAQELDLPARKAAATLGGLIRRGWLKRIRRGLYLVLPLEADARTSGIVEDPWLLAIELFSPCYVGGWSAAEHWGLTEQLFRSTFVVSAGRIRRCEQRVGGVSFHVVKVQPQRVETVKSVWRGRDRVAVSSPERTIMDALVTPAWLGGIRHLAEIVEGYRRGPSWNPDRLLEEVSHVGNGASLRRLGFLIEALDLEAPELGSAILAKQTAGVVKLDPGIRSRGRLVKRWGLWVNATIGKGGGHG